MTDLVDHWDAYWQEAFDETKQRSPEFDPADYYRSGRVSKIWPDKEGPEWWHVNGPKFVQSWVKWREFCGLEIASFDSVDEETGELISIPGIELECWAYGPDGLVIRSFIDRVFEDPDGRLYIVDLKTGSSTPPWPLQLALNNLCLKATYGESAKYGGYWSARKGGIVGGLDSEWADLRIYTDEYLWDMAWKAREIRDRQLFLANPGNLCKSACGVKQFCLAMGGTPPTLFLDTVQP